MNRNHKVRNITFGIAAGALAAAGLVSMDAQAAPYAGATAVISYTATESSKPADTAAYKTDGKTMVAGANGAIAGILADVKANTVFAGGEEDKVVISADVVTVDPEQDLAVAQVSDYVNVRSDASADSEVVGLLFENNVAKIEAEVEGWYKITSGNVSGFVKKDYLMKDADLVSSVRTTTASVKTATLYIRNDKSTDSEVLGMISGGEELTVLDDAKDGWVKVETETGEGFVAAEYVSVEISYPYGETLAEFEERIAEEEEADRLAEEAVAKAEAEKKAKEEARKAKAEEAKKAQESANNEETAEASQPAEEAAEEAMEEAADAPAETYDNGSGANIVNYACQFVGNPYVYGGTSLTNGTDCSGFVMSVYRAFGVSLPHSSYSLRSVGQGVSTSDMQPGDIVCYSGHVAIYVGNGTIVHASSPSTGIKYSNVNYKTILGVRRIF